MSVQTVNTGLLLFDIAQGLLIIVTCIWWRRDERKLHILEAARDQLASHLIEKMDAARTPADRAMVEAFADEIGFECEWAEKAQ